LTQSSQSRSPLTTAGGHVKIRFDLDQDESGYPPVRIENLWAVPLGSGTFQIDNIPFFVCGVSCEDIVAARADAEGTLRYAGLVRMGGHSTVRTILYDQPSNKTTLTERTQRLRAHLKSLGCWTEQSHIPGLVSVDIPANVNLEAVRQFLQKGLDDSAWDYEEATIAQ